ncbi:hypothetical protein Nepgr_005924 [Nepenthes gracilis]|uniref:BHLH domain-containing protein n=1 Tax=Nepenthes gracilis TaxID=150966 RepID=A0AAD3S4F3_NEPGR|nr:hypothetical protein Nepgr_005924 [Nepenthes gracilis]
MDSFFQLSVEDRARLLDYLTQTLGCNYTCLWSYSSTHNCLYFIDGYYRQETNEATSSSGSLAYRLFNEYRQQSIFINVEDDLVPGLAFKSSIRYVELGEADLQRRASTESQRRFYLEARIKTAAFMGCRSGEIELGMSNLPQINLEMEMNKLFPEDFRRQEQNRPSSSSSLSIDSPEYPSLLVNIQSSPYLQEQLQEAPIIKQPTTEPTPTTISFAMASPQEEEAAVQAFRQLQHIPFPTAKSTDAEITRAILAILSTPASSSSTLQTQQTLPHESQLAGQKASAFTRYKTAALGPPGHVRSTGLHRKNMIKRAFAFLKSLNGRKLQVHGEESHPTSRLHHMISERRRRGKINESFLQLRSLLPPGTKRDKASVLRTATEYMSSLKDQISELSEKSQQLEAQLRSQKEKNISNDYPQVNEDETPANGAVNLRIIPVSESTSEGRIADLLVTSGRDTSMINLVIQILEFLKQVRPIKLMSMEAQIRAGGQTRVVLRLRIQGSDWDECAFLEAVKRVVAQHVAHSNR